MSEIRLNAYHIMWIFVFFDLPTYTKTDRKNASKFRLLLEKDGFAMMQFSVYIRYCGSLESVKVHIKRVQSFMPDKGTISVLTITDKQYASIINCWGKAEKKKLQVPMQLEIF